MTFETLDTLQLFSVMAEQDASSSVCTCTCKQHADVHVVNTVLTYVMYSMSRANADSLVQVMNSTFSDEEMVSAKNVLWSAGDEKILGKNLKRTSSENRTKRFILCTDVVEAMQKLDERGEPMPQFVCDADGVGRLPRFSPEDLNVVTLDERCRQLERQMHSMQHQLNLRTDAWSKVEDQVDLMRTSMSQQVCRIRGLEEAAGAATPTRVEPPGVSGDSACSLKLTQLAKSGVSDVKLFSDKVKNNVNDANSATIKSDGLSLGDVSTSSGVQPVESNGNDVSTVDQSGAKLCDGATSEGDGGKTGAKVNIDTANASTRETAGTMLESGAGAAKDSDGAKNKELGEGFQFPKRRRVRGKATDDVKAFSAAEFTPLPKLFLSNVKNGVSIATIKEWLKKKNINFVGLYRKSKEHYVHQSFVITVTNETYNKVFDEALWPPGVTVREYGPPIRQDG